MCFLPSGRIRFGALLLCIMHGPGDGTLFKIAQKANCHPQADIPVVQLSIDETQPASFHYERGF
jgi:hypothetical protein